MKDIFGMIGLRDRDLRSEGFFVAEGRLLVERTIAAGYAVEAIFADAATAAEAEALARAPSGTVRSEKIPVQVCTSGELDGVAGFPFHRGMFALARRPQEKRLSALPALPTARSPVLVLPAITDPGNLGTLLRSALAFGYGEIWLGNESCDPFNRKALRASMGAALTLKLFMAEPADLMRFVDANGTRLPVYAAAMEEDALALGTDRTEPCVHALMLGNEYSGIPRAWRAVCTAAVQIPVSGEVDSLNVAIAGSILMWALGRQALPRRS